MSGLFTELKRRNVIKVAIVYAVVAWLAAQIVTVISGPLRLPDWFATAVIVLVIIGFPFAVILAWAFELTPQGLKRTTALPAAATVPETSPDTDRGNVASLSVDEASVAVLPFVNMSSDPEQEYFSDGISEELLNQLAKLRDLHVAGRTSSFQFKGHVGDISNIAAQLKVAHVLEGSVRKAGNRVRVTAQLIKAANGYHLWSETYDRDLDDIFAIQEDIALAVTDALSITLGVGDLKVGTRNVAAYEAFLAGRALYYQGGLDNFGGSIERLREAVKRDPNFVECWALLAWVLTFTTVAFQSREQEPELRKLCDEAITRACEVDPDNPAALAIKGLREFQACRWQQGDELLDRAVAIAPNNVIVLNTRSNLLNETGRMKEAAEATKQWARVEPLYVMPAYLLGVNLEAAGKLDQAEAQYHRASSLDGDVNAYAGPVLALALTRRDRAGIEAGLERVLARNLGFPGHQELTAAMGEHLDNPAAALQTLRGFLATTGMQRAPIVTSVIALWASYFGDNALALTVFRGLHEARAPLFWTCWRPMHREMRRLPGFKQLLRDRGLVDYWRKSGRWADLVRPVGDDDFEML